MELLQTSILYYPVVGLVVLYLGILYFLNRIPHLSVKSLGWLCIKNVTISTSEGDIHVKKIQFAAHILREKASPLKLFNINFFDVNFKRVANNEPNNGSKGRLDPKVLNFFISKRLYEVVFYRRIINQCNVNFFRTSLGHSIDDPRYMFFDYIRLENFYSRKGTNKIVATVVNGYLQNIRQASESDNLKFIRNLELCITCDTITSCNNDMRNKVGVVLTNFDVALSLGRMEIPFDDLKPLEKISNDKEEEIIDNGKSDLNVDLAEGFLQLFSTVNIKLEDFSISSQDIKFKVGNFHTSFTNVNDTLTQDADTVDLSIFITSCKLFHKESKCFELPSGSFDFAFNPLEFVKVIHKSRCDIEDTLSNPILKTLKLESSFNIAKPVFDIYYDQLDLFVQSTHTSQNKTRDANEVHLAGFLSRMQKFYSKIIVVDTIINLHLPKLGSSEFHRTSHSNMIISCKLSTFVCKGFTKELKKQTEKETEIHRLQGFFKLKNLKFDVADNSIVLSKANLLISYNVFKNLMAIKLITKNIKLKSINDIIFHLVRNFRNRHIILFNKAYDSFNKSNTRERLSPKIEFNNSNDTLELYELLPSFISSLKINCSNIQADIICKDGLPSYIIHDHELGQDVDLGDFKRGVSFKFSSAEFSFKPTKEEIISSIKSLQMFTITEYKNEFARDPDPISNYQSSNNEFSDVSSLESESSYEMSADNLTKVKRVLHISDISLNNKKENDRRKDNDRLILGISAIDGNFDIFLAWCSIYASSLIKYFAPTVKRACTKEEMKELKGPSRKLKLDVLVDSAAIVSRLPNNVEVLFEFDSMKMTDVLESKSTSFKYARLYVVHPATKFWSRLLVIADAKFNYYSSARDEISFETVSEGIRLNIPHQFLFYTVIDNLITLVKGIKQIKFNFDNISSNIRDYKPIMPEVKNAVILPGVSLKSKTFGFTLENDPFENELSYIYELGMIEQKERLKKSKIFEEKAESIIASAKPSMEDIIRLSNKDPASNRFMHSSTKPSTPKHNSPLRNIFSDNHNHLRSSLTREKSQKKTRESLETRGEENDSSSQLTNNEAERKVSDARERLNKYFATSWIQRFRKFRTSKICDWNERTKKYWGDEQINTRISEKFNILNYATGPSLMSGAFKDVDLTVTKARIADVDKFIYEYGKKQPRLDYSILIPLYFSLKSTSLYIALRDYPLPMVSFPPSNVPDDPTINFSGNFVINEKLVHRKEELRFVYVPFSPATESIRDLSDNFYSVFVPRTLTPVKVMIDAQCDLNTNNACMVTWCKSYQAALSAVSGTFDKFTKPKIDDSPIGWWDKISLLVHGKVAFNISNELCLHMKSSTNPYEIIGRSSGFVFCWKNNVNLKINDTGKSEELIMLDSDDFVFAIPDYSIAERQSWSMFHDSGKPFSTDAESGVQKFQKKIIKLSSTERVRWILGVSFERNKNYTNELSDQQERISLFQPHYDVCVTSPDFDWHPDSYRDFRSQYIHMALSVVSKSSTGNSHNAAYFTPFTFHYFFHWWDTLTKHSSLPVRQGSLYSKDPIDITHIKMGNHMFTVKYKLIFEPITISHFYIHSSNGGIGKKNKIAFTGLKGKFSKCAVDLHQRKELIRYVNEELNINNNAMHLKMNQGGVDIVVADIRLINAVFNENSLRSYIASDLKSSNESTDSPSIPTAQTSNDEANTFGEWTDNQDDFENEFSWVDPDDFVELHERGVLSSYPQLTVIPFFFSPRFTYFREFSLHEEGPFPFGYESFHDCIIGLHKPEETQKSLLLEREKVIEKEREKIKGALHSNELSDQTEELNECIRTCDAKLSVIKSMEETLLKQDNALPCSAEFPKRQKPEYFNRNCYDQMREMSTANSSASEFHNRFVVHNPQLKWNNKLRDLFMDYIQKVGDRKSHVYYMSKKAVDLAAKFANATDDEFENTTTAEEVFAKEVETGEETLAKFHELINEVNNDEHEVEDKYLIKLIHPQIQLVSEKDNKSCVLITSKDVEMKIVSINVKGLDDLVSDGSEVSKLVESRYGVVFRDSHIFVFRKDQQTIDHPDFQYGHKYSCSNANWPPWLDLEVFYDSSWLQDKLVVERSSMSILLKKPNLLVASDIRANTHNDELNVHMTKLVINADSYQYSTVYYMITDLLLQGHTKRDELLDKLEKIASLTDAKDMSGVDVRIRDLQESIRTYVNIFLNLNQRGISLNKLEREQLTRLQVGLERKKLELNILMRGLGIKSSRLKVNNKSTAKYCTIVADQVIWHLLNNNRKPFIDFALARTKFIRIDNADGSNINRANISMIQGFNLDEGATYPELLRPRIESNHPGKIEINETNDKPIFEVSWKMLNHIGGIPIVQEARLDIEPLKVQLDYTSTKKLFEYLFPKDEEKEERNEEKNIDESDVEVESNNRNEYEDTSKGFSNPLRGIFSRRKKNLLDSIADEDFEDLDSSAESLATSIPSSGDISINSDMKDKNIKKLFLKLNKKKTDNDPGDDLDIIMNRSSKYISIINIEVSKVELCISFKAPMRLSILNIQDLELTIPDLRYRNKMWSLEEFVLRFRKDIIKIILNQTGKILSNKFRPNKRRSNIEPLKQVSNYASFMTLQDLQQAGRSRDTIGAERDSTEQNSCDRITEES